MNQVITALTQALKKNASTINLVLLSLVILFLFPLDHFLQYDIKSKVEEELSILMENVWVRALVSLLVFGAFQAGNVNMLVLLLYVIHYITFHE